MLFKSIISYKIAVYDTIERKKNSHIFLTLWRRSRQLIYLVENTSELLGCPEQRCNNRHFSLHIFFLFYTPMKWMNGKREKLFTYKPSTLLDSYCQSILPFILFFCSRTLSFFFFFFSFSTLPFPTEQQIDLRLNGSKSSVKFCCLNNQTIKTINYIINNSNERLHQWASTIIYVYQYSFFPLYILILNQRLQKIG